MFSWQIVKRWRSAESALRRWTPRRSPLKKMIPASAWSTSLMAAMPRNEASICTSIGTLMPASSSSSSHSRTTSSSGFPDHWCWSRKRRTRVSGGRLRFIFVQGLACADGVVDVRPSLLGPRRLATEADASQHLYVALRQAPSLCEFAQTRWNVRILVGRNLAAEQVGDRDAEGVGEFQEDLAGGPPSGSALQLR